ncbi:MAG: PilZ domain-containing protein [Myxococcales bacterium]|nr:PilZ domain-containing protein [Myxococcota bacterium]MDW8282559.1 PilZ domain-containing protein [Myxococcales bacterium]
MRSLPHSYSCHSSLLLHDAEEGAPEVSIPPVLPRTSCSVQAGDCKLVSAVSNMSLQGLFIPTAETLPEGTEVKVQVGGLADDPILAEGQVAWSGHGPLGTTSEPGLAVRLFKIHQGEARLRAYTRRRYDLLKAKYVPIESIVPLVFFTADHLPGLRTRIAHYTPSPLLEQYIAGYAEIGMKHRQRFIWQFTRVGVEVEMLPCVDPELADLVNDIKTLGVMVDVLLDDLADEVRDRRRLETLISLLEYRLTGLGGPPSPTGDRYADFGVHLWEQMWRMAEKLPRYEEFAPLLRFDWQQMFISMRYALLLSEVPLAQNMPEQDTYIPHSMHMMCNATLDLMCSSRFCTSDLSVLRRAVRVAQRMGCISNMLTTWERELATGDFTSAVFGYAFHRRILSHAEARALPPAVVAERIRAAHLQRYFLLDFENLRSYLLGLAGECHSVDLARFTWSLDDLLMLHLSGTGLM